MFETKAVTLETLTGEVKKLLETGYRFITMTAVDLKDEGQEILYHFDDQKLREIHLRLAFSKGTKIPSISSVYFASVLVENEIRDTYDIHFSDLPLDYSGTFYLEGEVVKGPMCNYTIIKQ
jgi:ech hydrogenase subunit D